MAKSARVVDPSKIVDQPAAVAAPVKTRRRPAFLAGSVAAVLLGALGAAWLWTATTSTVEVVAARSTVARGAEISAGDLVSVRIGVDPSLQVIPAAEMQNLIGKRAALDIAAGGLVTRAEVTESVIPDQGMAVVGLSLGSGFLPSIPLQRGDRVRIVRAPDASAAQASSAPTVTISAEVVSTSRTTDGAAALVDVSVPADAAPGLAAAAASGKVSLVLDSRVR